MKDPEFFLKMILDEVLEMILDKSKSRVLLDPNFSLVMLDDDELYLKWFELWLGDGQENYFLVFEVGTVLEDRVSACKSTLESKSMD